MAAEATCAVQDTPSGLARRRLTGGRWHFQHGPIDLIIQLDGEGGIVAHTIEALWQRFSTLLGELVAELDLLRRPVEAAGSVRGSTARRMVAACERHLPAFITPMAAVAGAVADELMQGVRDIEGIRRGHINNGGDIALHLTPGTHYRVGIVANIDGRMRATDRADRSSWREPACAGSTMLDSGLRRNDGGEDPAAAGAAARPSGAIDSGDVRSARWPALDGTLRIDHASAVRGIATSGWRGRSFSLGIADSVTVLARDAATADAAATMIANAVDVDDPAVRRAPARRLRDDSDLGDRLVTTEVGRLMPAARRAALDSGEAHARMLVQRGLIVAAALMLQGEARVVASEDSRST